MRMVLVVALLILAAVLLIQNTGIATIHLLFWKLSMSQAVLALILLLIGFLAGLLASKLRGRLF
ncbi:MAG: DUF1049 domain-containing protein [Candidatus Eisenbacteria bacterium]|nr:DUF1049 domain-containing protein [Candidatus Eisenbacteria bacterium]